MGIRISSIYRHTVIEGTGKLDVGEYELQLFDSRYMIKEHEEPKKWRGVLKPSCVPISIILILIILVVLLPLLEQKQEPPPDRLLAFGYNKLWGNCSSPCELSLVENIPEAIRYKKGSSFYQSTFHSWMHLIGLAKNSIDIASHHWDLKKVGDKSALDFQGNEVFQTLLSVGVNENLRIRIVQNKNREKNELGKSASDLEILNKIANSEIRWLDSAYLLDAKIWIVDEKHFYIGSADAHWLTFSKTKDLGITSFNCSCLAQDIGKIFDTYWSFAKFDTQEDTMSVSAPKKVPHSTLIKLPSSSDTTINKENPVALNFNETLYYAYFASGPQSINPNGRSNNLDTILEVIDKATTYLDLVTPFYLPILSNAASKNGSRTKSSYWSVVDEALRKAAIDRRVKIRILSMLEDDNNGTSEFKSLQFLKSLVAMSNDEIQISARVFKVEFDYFGDISQRFSNQYIITDNHIYLGSTSWTGDDLLKNAAAAVVISLHQENTNASEIQSVWKDFRQIFERDWTSEYAQPVELIVS